MNNITYTEEKAIIRKENKANLLYVKTLIFVIGR